MSKLGLNLKLKVTKGPSSGREFDFKPGIKVNIGRVVSGNKVTIKEAGISSKHLTLQFDSGSGQWTITDLDSSNGTLLNSESLAPFTPYPLSQDDVIRIGEETVISVHLEVKDEGNSGRPLRVTRRRVAAEGAKLGDIDENRELGLVFGEELVESEKKKKKGRGRRGRPPRVEVTKSGKDGESSENLGENEVKESGEAIVSIKRVTRSSTRVKNSENEAKIGEVKRGGRQTRSARKVEISENVVDDNNCTDNTGAIDVEKGWGMRLRRRRHTTKEEILGENRSQGRELVKLDVVDGRRQKGTRGRKNLNVEVVVSQNFENDIRNEEVVESADVGEKCCLCENGKTREEEEDCGGEEMNGECDLVENVQEKDNFDVGRTNGAELASSSGVEENNILAKLETMTLGEWFDYLEEYLPKQIVEETEKMILEMRLTAEKVHEFMLQHKPVKGSGGGA